MGIKTYISILLICILMLTPAFGAKITGAIYDHDLTPIKKSIVTINTTPSQARVSQYGGYYFIVEPGTYLITSTLSRNEITKEIASETITITQEGEFVRDLFLYPDFNLQEEFKDSIGNKVKQFFTVNGILIGTIFGALLILTIITLFGTKYVNLLFKREMQSYIAKKKRKDKSTETKKEHVESKPLIVPKSVQEKTDQIINDKIKTILKKKTQHIATQKEIRREFRLSEAKISLILTQMEQKGQIVKIKQGRRNMIQLKK